MKWGGIGNGQVFFESGCETQSCDSTTAEKVSVLQNLRVLSIFSKGSDCWKMAKKGVTDVLQELSDDIRLTEFDSFAEVLLQLLEKHLDTACAGCIRSRSVLKEKPWIAFHQLRIDELPKKWS